MSEWLKGRSNLSSINEDKCLQGKYKYKMICPNLVSLILLKNSGYFDKNIISVLQDQNVNKMLEMFRKRIENKTQNIIMLLYKSFECTCFESCMKFFLTSPPDLHSRRGQRLLEWQNDSLEKKKRVENKDGEWYR